MNQNRIVGLDTLRFIAALWVAMGHGAIPPLTSGYDPGQPLAWAVNGVWTASISGPAAVIVFFIISGLCIHYPFACGKRFEILEFSVRRSIRIVLPMAAAILFARSAGGVDSGTSDLLAGIPAWSLVAELVYYALYPVLRRIPPKLSWSKILGISFVLSLVFALTKPINNVNYPAWGYWGDWFLGLPCWLMGVVLAERIGCRDVLPPASPRTVWLLRGGAAALGSLTSNLALQRIVGHHLTLNFFALYVSFWLSREVRYYNSGTQSSAPPRFLEWAGSWSYSLYLVHITAFHAFDRCYTLRMGYVADWIVGLSFVLIAALGFYLLFERPAHGLARILAYKVRNFQKIGAEAHVSD